MDLTIVVTIISAVFVFVSSIIGVFFALRKLSIEDRSKIIEDMNTLNKAMRDQLDCNDKEVAALKARIVILENTIAQNKDEFDKTIDRYKKEIDECRIDIKELTEENLKLKMQVRIYELQLGDKNE